MDPSIHKAAKRIRGRRESFACSAASNRENGSRSANVKAVRNDFAQVMGHVRNVREQIAPQDRPSGSALPASR